MSELTSTSKKIMEVFRYFKVRHGEYLSIKLLQSKRGLWRDIEEEQFSDAIEELVGAGYISHLEAPAGWKLTEQGYQYLKSLEGKY